jgi:hypothetical protein
MAMPDFPNGFDSWQKTHFEVVEVLCYIRELETSEQPKSFAEMYQLALALTNKYEEQSKGKARTRNLFDDIEEFVWKEVRKEA